MAWHHETRITSQSYVCGYCSNGVASASGFHDTNGRWFIRICPHCQKPTFFEGEGQVPGPLPGNTVGSLPDVIRALNDEARRCIAAGSPTAAVLAFRKLLMHIAVEQGANENLKFIQYVEYLANKGYVPPNGTAWVDHIRKKGNDANHEIVLMSAADANELMLFSEMLLKFIYEFPNRVTK